MSAADYIIARIHPAHPKILRLAELTGESEYTIVGRAIAWFRHIDQHCRDARTGLGERAFARIWGHDAYWTACQDPHVNWITVDEQTQTAAVVEYANNFSKSSKRRMLKAKQKANTRLADKREARASAAPPSRPQSVARLSPICRQTVANSGDLQQQLQLQEERQQQQTNPPSARTGPQPGAAVAAAAAAAEISPTPDPDADTPPQARSPVVDALVAAGVSEPTRTQLAALEGITAEIVTACAKRARAAGKGIGVVVQDIRTAVEAARVKAAAPPPGPTREQARVREASEHAARVDAERRQAQEVISGLSDGELTAFHQAALRTLKPSDPVYSAWQHADPRDPGKYHGLRAAIVRLAMDTKTERATA